VQDTGVGIPHLFGKQADSAERHPFFGIGLSNVYDRLQQLFERSDLLAFSSDPEKGTRAILMIPPRRFESA
jgi:sensor histidine kinase YesM